MYDYIPHETEMILGAMLLLGEFVLIGLVIIAFILILRRVFK